MWYSDLEPRVGSPRTRSPARARPGTRVLLLLLVLSGLLAGPVSAQIPPQIRLLRENPQLVRQQLMDLGITPDAVRQRLREAGYASNLLDDLLRQGAATGTDTLTDQQLEALGSLGLAAEDAEGLEPLPLDTGVAGLPGDRRTRRDPAAEELELFGLDAFRARTTRFQPVLSGPVPPSYKLGPGDVLVLVLTGDVEFAHQLAVTREGFVVIPQVGQLFVNELTMAQLDDVLRERLGRSYSGIRTGTTRFDVTISRLRANQVYVNGEVVQPGAYQLAAVATVLNALYAAGGPTERGNFRGIRVIRGGRTVSTLDLYDYLLDGSADADVVLQQGDVVFVPLQGPRVEVTGAVTRPAIYELDRGETLADVVAMAGGLRPDARMDRVAVHRILPAPERGPGLYPRAVVDVPLDVDAGRPVVTRNGEPNGGGHDGANGHDGRERAAAGVTVPALPMADGDSVVVDSVPTLDRLLHVTIDGEVQKPGLYEWRPGLTLRDLVTLARGPTVGADLREAEIARLPDDSELQTGLQHHQVVVTGDMTSIVGNYAFYNGGMRINAHEAFVRQADGTLKVIADMFGMR